LYDGWFKPAEGGQATISAATGANGLFYTELRCKGKREQNPKPFTTKDTKIHEGKRFGFTWCTFESFVVGVFPAPHPEAAYVEFWIRGLCL
jgi:hypothetical protein